MPEESWKPPPDEEDRDMEAGGADREAVRNLETRRPVRDWNPDAPYSSEDINLHGSER